MQTSKPQQAPNHGGRLNAAAMQFQIPLNDWLDLSTGINPNGWPVPAIPEHIFARLPEDDDKLIDAAQGYYKADNLLPIAGSQAAIQLLPALRPVCRVGIINPGYQEHAYCWQKSGHEVLLLPSDEIDSAIDSLEVLVLINPNNPTGETFTKQQLLEWHKKLSSKNGWLIVDEAFMDAETNNSLLQQSHQKGLIVLRSLGKFFGLAGLRVGFVFAENKLLTELRNHLGPWSLSNPSRYIATQALNDHDWQHQARQQLATQSEKLISLLTQYNLKPDGGTHLFQWVKHSQEQGLHDALASQGILVRLFEATGSLRFGLPKNENEYQRLQHALAKVQSKLQELAHE